MEERFECYTRKFNELSGKDFEKYQSYLVNAKSLAQVIDFQSLSSVQDLDTRISKFARSSMTDKFGFTNSLHAKLAIDYFIETTIPQGPERANLEKLSTELGKMYLANKDASLETVVQSMATWVSDFAPKNPHFQETQALYQSFYTMLSLVEPWSKTLGFVSKQLISGQLTKTATERGVLLNILKDKISAVNPTDVHASMPNDSDAQPIDSFIKTIQAQIHYLERVNSDLHALTRVQSPEDGAKELLAALKENNTRLPPLYFVDFIAVEENKRKLESFLNTLPAEFSADRTTYEAKITPALTPSMTNNLLGLGSRIAGIFPQSIKDVVAPYAPVTPDSQAKEALETLLTKYLGTLKPPSTDALPYQGAIDENNRAKRALGEVIDIARGIGGINKKISEIQADIANHEDLKGRLSVEEAGLGTIKLELSNVQRQVQEQSQGLFASIRQFFRRILGFSDPLAQKLEACQRDHQNKTVEIETLKANVEKFEEQCSGYRTIIEKLDGLTEDVKARVTQALNEEPSERTTNMPAPGSPGA